MRVRAAIAEDALGIAAVQVAAWRFAYRGQMPDAVLDRMSVEGRTTQWRDRILDANAARFTLVAESDGEVRGFVSAGPARGEAEGIGEVYAINVDPAAIGTGVGRALLEAAVGALAAQGFERAILWVLAENPRARRFYEIAGWRADGGEKTQDFGGAVLLELRYSRGLGGERSGDLGSLPF